MGKFIDLTGKIFGKLLVLERAGSNKSKGALWKCRCSCLDNTIVTVSSNSLISGNTTSCGCFKKKRVSETHRKYNTYILTGIYGVGRTVEGEEFYFDLEDYDRINKYYWSINRNGYVYNELNKIFLHKYVVNSPKNMQVDHINHNIKDCRKEFLRICSNQQNNFNKDKYKNNTSGFKGAYFDKRCGKWFASIKINYKNKFLGYSNTPEEANELRKKADIKYFGEFRYVEV